jgi:hypothetical protein
MIQLVIVMTCWKEHIGPNVPAKIQDIINKALVAPDLHNALMAVAEARGSQLISPDRLGRWLRKVDGRIISGNTLRRAGVVDGYQKWVLASGLQ